MPPHLPPTEITLLRALKKTAIVLMLLYRLDKPIGEIDIAGILDIHPASIRTYLRSLARLGLITRTHRYSGWILTNGGRQMLLGAFIGEEIQEHKTAAQDQKIKTSAKNSRSSPAAATILSLSFKEDNNQAAAATAEASAKNSRSSAKISRSLMGRRKKTPKKEDRTTQGKPRSDPMVQANLEAFASIGLARNDFVLEVCKMDHVTPDYILGQKRRLESERRYSHGLLLTVIRCNDFLPEKYHHWEEPSTLCQFEPEPEEESDLTPKIEPDSSIYEPLSENGMTALNAWTAALRQLKTDMSKGTYETWVKDTILLSARDGLFVIGTSSDDACNWLASRLTSTIKRLITGICDRSVEVMFANINRLTEQN